MTVADQACFQETNQTDPTLIQLLQYAKENTLQRINVLFNELGKRADIKMCCVLLLKAASHQSFGSNLTAKQL